MRDITMIIPAFNEAEGIRPTLERLQAVARADAWNMEIIVVDDGSSDNTAEVARSVGAHVIRNPMNGGYGLSLRRGIRAARHELVAITDADGTYQVEELPRLLNMMDAGLDMAVGSRQGATYRQNWWKHPARIIFRIIAEFVSGRKIPDINSGLRVMRRSVLLPYLERTCMGFSFTTSITLILMLNGHFVDYHPVVYAPRIGASKVRHVRDTLRTAQILTSIIAAHNPIKLAILADILLAIVIFMGTLLFVFSPSSAWGMAALIGSGGLLAAMPVVFMLGCLGEIWRVNTRQSQSSS